MVRQIGDIWPAASGGASLGVEQINFAGGFTNEIRPFANIHMNSGIWHDPMVGNSGVMRFDGRGLGVTTATLARGKIPSFELSVDGGQNYFLSLGTDIANTTTPSVIQSRFAGMQVRASGQLDLLASTSAAFRTVNGSMTFESSAATPTAGPMTFAADGTIVFQTTANQGQIQLQSGRDVLIRSSIDPTLSAENRQIEVQSRAGNVIVSAATTTAGANGTGGQISLQPFGTSGALEYRYGPYQSWAMKTRNITTGGPANDGYHPIPYSGQIVQMIHENAVRSITDIFGNTITQSNITAVGVSGVDVRVNNALSRVTVSGTLAHGVYFANSNQASFTGTFVTLTLPDVIKEDTGFSISTGVITLPYTGWYRVSYSLNIAGGSTVSNYSQHVMVLNGVVGVGTALQVGIGYTENNATKIIGSVSKDFIWYFRGGDNLRIQSRRLTGSDTQLHATGCVIKLEFIGNK